MIYRRLVNRIIKGEKANGRIDISLVNDAVIWELNKKYRKKDKPTDVLAFPYGPGPILGDVIISIETAQKNARHYGVTYKQELKRLIIHGVLHVLGYDHGRAMSRAEKTYQKS